MVGLMNLKRPMTRQEWFAFLTSVHGRISRRTYNFFFLFLFLLFIALNLMDVAIYGIDAVMRDNKVSFLNLFVQFLAMWPCIVIVGRRLHDLGYSSWWQLFWGLLLMGLGALALLVFYKLQMPIMLMITMVMMVVFSLGFWIALSCVKGQTGDNRFGPDPLMKKEVVS
jgi:uncharacterized membrane protein YhaH (DUF805 family)